MNAILFHNIEKQLELEAQHSGLSLEQYSAQVLVRHLEEVQKRQSAVAVLESWLVGDADEQAATGKELVRLLDEDRLSARQLFPLLKPTSEDCPPSLQSAQADLSH